ncbi:hypothetical protein EHQ42_04630 [Leptospira levettii]|nr:hypothetical protein EHQ42_04630 [Leptospira levettii]
METIENYFKKYIHSLFELSIDTRTIYSDIIKESKYISYLKQFQCNYFVIEQKFKNQETILNKNLSILCSKDIIYIEDNIIHTREPFDWQFLLSLTEFLKKEGITYKKVFVDMDFSIFDEN